MTISTRGRYALRAMVDIMDNQSRGNVSLKDIAERQEISEKYLEGIVKELVKAGLITAQRGKGGGYRLKRDPDQYTAGEIVRLLEGNLAPVSCLGDYAEPCSRAGECRTLFLWKGLQEVINDYLDKYTLADLQIREEAGFDYVI